MTGPDDLDHGLRQMLDDVPPHDDRARQAAMEALPTTRQRRFRWWPPLGSPRATRAAPTYAGLAIASVALIAIGVFGIGSVERLSGTGGQPDMRPPQLFEGSIACGPELVTPTTTATDTKLGDTDSRIFELRGGSYTLHIESMGDPRLEGALTDQIDTDRYGVGVDALELSALTWTIENEGGSWTTQFPSFTTDPIEWATVTTRWDGAGDYEGLVSLMQIDYLAKLTTMECGWEIHGVVVPASTLPAHPEPGLARVSAEPMDPDGA